MPAHAAPIRRDRLLVAVVAGVIAILASIAHGRRSTLPSDFDLSWFASRALLTGRDPYPIVGPGGTFFDWPWGLYYPLTTAAGLLPLAALPVAVARALFIGGSAALLAYAVTRHQWDRLAMLASASFVHAAMIGQWSPLLTAAAVMPSLAFLLALKPTVGAAVVAASLAWRVTWRAALGGMVCAVVAFALVPGWVGEWRAALTGAFHFQTLIARPAGVLLLLALLRWRRFDARLVLALACVPQTPVIYEALPLFLVPESRREMLVLLLCSGLELVVQQAMMRGLDGPASAHASGTALLIVMYFPCLIMVLRRPNAGSIPAPTTGERSRSDSAQTGD